VYYRKVFTAVLSVPCVVRPNVYLYNWETLLLFSSVVIRKLYNILAIRVVKLNTMNVGCLEAALV